MENNKVPKIIWQTYELDYDDLRYDYRMASLTWKNLNPEWEYRYCNAKTREIHVKKYSDELYFYYRSLDNINKADVWRLCVLYKYGGLYTDMDSTCQMPIDYTFKNWIKNDNFVLTPKMPDGLSITGTIASIKKSNTTKKIIEDLLIEIKNTPIEGDYIKHIEFNTVANIMKKYYEEIDFGLLSPLHGGHAADAYVYSSDFFIRCDGEDILYSNLAKNNKWIF
jgi:hypothetical protein